MTPRLVCEMAMELNGVTEKDHFGSRAFIANGRIFATVWTHKNEVNLMLNRENQREFLAIDGEGFREIDNAWGANAFNVQLAFVDAEDFARALKLAWATSGEKRARPARRSPPKKKRDR